MIKTNAIIKLEVFNPIKVKILKKLSEIDKGYLDYPEEDKDAGTIMEIVRTPAEDIYLEQSGMVFCVLNSQEEDFDFFEGIHFEFI